MTEHGGSGSFTILFSGLRKLTTVATIPYYTGQYGRTPRGFGYVTIGANVDDFHRAATESGQRIGKMIGEADALTQHERDTLVGDIADQLRGTTTRLAASTLAMVLAVILIAIWMAGLLSRRITHVSMASTASSRATSTSAWPPRAATSSPNWPAPSTAWPTPCNARSAAWRMPATPPSRPTA